MFSLKVKQKILDRSGQLCERKLPNGKRCLARVSDIHHIVAKKMGGRKGVYREAINDERNSMAVCRKCHDMASMWNPDATELVPGGDFRTALVVHKGMESFYPLRC